MDDFDFVMYCFFAFMGLFFLALFGFVGFDIANYVDLPIYMTTGTIIGERYEPAHDEVASIKPLLINYIPDEWQLEINTIKGYGYITIEDQPSKWDQVGSIVNVWYSYPRFTHKQIDIKQIESN